MTDTPTAIVTVAVDAARCVGSATCTTLAPASFALDEHDRSAPSSPATTDVAAVELARDLCPSGAIRILRAEPALE
jgi:ferredoxin